MIYTRRVGRNMARARRPRRHALRPALISFSLLLATPTRREARFLAAAPGWSSANCSRARATIPSYRCSWECAGWAGSVSQPTSVQGGYLYAAGGAVADYLVALGATAATRATRSRLN